MPKQRFRRYNGAPKNESQQGCYENTLFRYRCRYLSFFFSSTAACREVSNPWEVPAPAELSVKLATIGPGDELYSWWGHTAFILEDARTNTSRLYDYGQFTFDPETFVRNFVFGRLWFSTARSITENTLADWEAEERSITIQELSLPPEAKAALYRKLEHDIRPENRTYLYDHYKDNCATRPRDIINNLVSGAFKERYSGKSRYTLRDLSRRYTRHYPVMNFIIMFLLGHSVDKPITLYEEMFLPEKLKEHLSTFSYSLEGEKQRSIVSHQYLLSESSSADNTSPKKRTAHGPVSASRSHPTDRSLTRHLILGCALAGLTFFLFYRFIGSPYRRISAFRTRRPPTAFYPRCTATGYPWFIAAFCLLFGVLGLILFFMAGFTDHTVTYNNENLFIINPLLLPVFFFSLSLGTKRRRNRDVLRSRTMVVQGIFFTMLAGSGAVLTVLKLFSVGFYQENWEMISLVLPIYVINGPVGLFIVQHFEKRL